MLDRVLPPQTSVYRSAAGCHSETRSTQADTTDQTPWRCAQSGKSSVRVLLPSTLPVRRRYLQGRTTTVARHWRRALGCVPLRRAVAVAGCDAPERNPVDRASQAPGASSCRVASVVGVQSWGAQRHCAGEGCLMSRVRKRRSDARDANHEGWRHNMFAWYTTVVTSPSNR